LTHSVQAAVKAKVKAFKTKSTTAEAKAKAGIL